MGNFADTSNASIKTAIEKRINNLEREKLVAQDQLATAGKPERPFHKMFELSMRFLSNSLNLWRSDRFEDKVAALRLTFSKHLQHHRDEGFRTPQMALPFKALESFCEGENMMARSVG